MPEPPMPPMSQNNGAMLPSQQSSDDVMGDNMTDGGGGFPSQDNMEGNSFDTNFDAGVQANESDDPKKYIQQLTGKLSQSLRQYQEQQENVDTELSKYVAGMVLKAASQGLNQKDVKSIIDKLNDAVEDNEDVDFNTSDNIDDNMDNNQSEQSMPPQSAPKKPFDGQESLKRRVFEITNDVLSNCNDCPTSQQRTQVKTKKYSTNPFKAPNFK